MVRGSYAHSVLEVTLHAAARADRARRGSRPTTWPRPSGSCSRRSTDLRGEFRLSPNQTRVRAAVRRLEFDLLRYLRHEAGRDGPFEPEHLELRFGFDDSEHPAVELADGTRVRGVIDRVDTWNGHALVRDYKSGKVDNYKVADWDDERRFQAALYMLVVERALGPAAPPAASTCRSAAPSAARAGCVAAELPSELGERLLTTTTCWPRDEFDERNECGASARSPRWRRACAPAGSPRARTPAPTAGGCSLPLDLPGGGDDRLHRRAAARDRAPRRLDSWSAPARAPARPPCWWSASCAPCWTTAWRWTRSWPSPSPRRRPPS